MCGTAEAVAFVQRLFRPEGLDFYAVQAFVQLLNAQSEFCGLNRLSCTASDGPLRAPVLITASTSNSAIAWRGKKSAGCSSGCPEE